MQRFVVLCDETFHSGLHDGRAVNPQAVGRNETLRNSQTLRNHQLIQESLKLKYLSLLDNFKRFNLEEFGLQLNPDSSSQKGKLKMSSSIMERTGNHDELLESKELAGLIKKLEDHMKNAYEEACKKNVRI